MTVILCVYSCISTYIYRNVFWLNFPSFWGHQTRTAIARTQEPKSESVKRCVHLDSTGIIAILEHIFNTTVQTIGDRDETVKNGDYFAVWITSSRQRRFTIALIIERLSLRTICIRIGAQAAIAASKVFDDQVSRMSALDHRAERTGITGAARAGAGGDPRCRYSGESLGASLTQLREDVAELKKTKTLPTVLRPCYPSPYRYQNRKKNLIAKWAGEENGP